MIARVMHFYSMSIADTLKLPVITFWMLSKNVDRITAEKDMKTAELVVKTQSADGIKDLFDGLKETLDVTIKLGRTGAALEIAEPLDREGLQGLKGLNMGLNGSV